METDKHLHSAVQGGFSRSAELYDRARSGYPPAVVDRLLKHLKVKEGSKVLELAAGTGKFTGHLRSANCDVTVVEPMATMRELLRRRMPELKILDAVAEAVPQPPASFDFIFAATAFHWFDPEETYSEMLRLLRPGGGVGLVWTTWSQENLPEWYLAIRKLIVPFEGSAPRYKHMKWRVPFDLGNEFQVLQFERFEVARVMTMTEICERMLSISYISALPELVFQALRREMEEILKEYTLRGQVFRMPEEIHCHWTFKRV